MKIFRKVKEVYKRHQKAMHSMSDDDILTIIRNNNGRITATGLARQTVLTYIQASLKLQSLYDKGYLKITYSNSGMTQIMVLKAQTLPTIASSSKLTDAKVLQVVIQAGGKITPAALCVALECSIDEARKKLDELQMKDVFDLEVTDKGAILYVLNDIDCFQDSKVKNLPK
ncbi:hypothetical protein [Microscilla marina]|uniref:Uncharacterized protein n=1 Tax=Microscilla marina ATCC 23134 TaxID=313606 RepID=A1ZGL1_MICM2|nr:hypothetical protein [Microscilla marina]EAY30628.1 hypothetical protein M23134_03266 [Microscilla marina ATCC 23134]